MDNGALFVVVFGVLALYFFGSFNVYRSLYKKIKEEKIITDNEKKELEKMIENYEKQLNASLETIADTEELLTKTREEVQKLKIRNSELRHRNELLQKRVDELYSSIGIV